MENKKLSLSIEEARHLYNSNDEVMKDIALRAYSEDELSFDFSEIKHLRMLALYWAWIVRSVYAKQMD